MANLIWSDELLTGIDLVDKQHRELFNQISRFMDACEQGQGQSHLLTILEFFENYVKLHFSAEERVQRDVGYPGYEAHLKLHTNLLRELDGFKSDIETQGATPGLVSSAMLFWTAWFVEHISIEDRAIADYFRQNQTTST